MHRYLFLLGTQQNQKYTVLLIIADGIINDMVETIKNIIRASATPLSIIIVGVGAADFSGMNTLDGDGVLLRSGASVALRDIVQFVSNYLIYKFYILIFL
jgi:hypothetical protein